MRFLDASDIRNSQHTLSEPSWSRLQKDTFLKGIPKEKLFSSFTSYLLSLTIQRRLFIHYKDIKMHSAFSYLQVFVIISYTKWHLGSWSHCHFVLITLCNWLAPSQGLWEKNQRSECSWAGLCQTTGLPQETDGLVKTSLPNLILWYFRGIRLMWKLLDATWLAEVSQCQAQNFL